MQTRLDQPFRIGDRVSISHYDWQLGELELVGTVCRHLSATHVKVRLDGGEAIAARIADCTVLDGDRSAA